MSVVGEVGVQRRRFLDGLSAEQRVAAAPWLALHLAQDGSATRLCETQAGGPVSLIVHDQCVTTEVPPEVRAHLPGTHFIERCVSLVHRGEVMMDNLSWIAVATAPADVRDDLLAGRLPIGHLLQRLWIRRAPLPQDQAKPLWPHLWRRCGEVDEGSVRSYVIATPDGPAMLITECFRQGLLPGLLRPASAG